MIKQIIKLKTFNIIFLNYFLIEFFNLFKIRCIKINKKIKIIRLN
jgi:hypothetical protein